MDDVGCADSVVPGPHPYTFRISDRVRLRLYDPSTKSVQDNSLNSNVIDCYMTILAQRHRDIILRCAVGHTIPPPRACYVNSGLFPSLLKWKRKKKCLPLPLRNSQEKFEGHNTFLPRATKGHWRILH